MPVLLYLPHWSPDGNDLPLTPSQNKINRNKKSPAIWTAGLVADSETEFTVGVASEPAAAWPQVSERASAELEPWQRPSRDRPGRRDE